MDIKTFLALDELKIGWAKAIKDTLNFYNLTPNFQEVKTTPAPEWKRKVKTSIETKNLERLIDLCHKQEGENKKVKTKTANIVPVITSRNYKRIPDHSILRTSKHETRTIMLARYGVLECGKNYKGTMKEICETCNCSDDENHRLNYCPKWKNMNLYEITEKLNFDRLYSDSLVDIRRLTNVIENVWNTRTANGSIRTE